MPPGTTLRGLYVSDRFEVFVDLDATVRTKHPGGSMQELLTVYSVVNTLLVNLPTMTEVQILDRRTGSRFARGSCGLASAVTEE